MTIIWLENKGWSNLCTRARVQYVSTMQDQDEDVGFGRLRTLLGGAVLHSDKNQRGMRKNKGRWKRSKKPQ